MTPSIAVNQQTPKGFTALHFAVAKGHVDAVMLLLESGADPRVRSWRDIAEIVPLRSAARPRVCRAPVRSRRASDRLIQMSRMHRYLAQGWCWPELPRRCGGMGLPQPRPALRGDACCCCCCYAAVESAVSIVVSMPAIGV